MNSGALEKSIEQAKKKMEASAAKLEFIEAAMYRDEMNKLKELLDSKS